MSGLLPSKAKKKKRTHEDHPNLKRVKLDNINNGNATKNPIQFETTLSLPIQEALCKFREASEQELLRLRKEGMDPSTAINKLMEKMRTVEGGVQSSFTRQELELVMEIAGVNEEGATRALILRSELAKLRHDGFNHPEAINELSRRMKRLAGSKRRGSLSIGEKLEGKHRKKETNTTTNTTNTPTTSTTSPTSSRVSFTRNLNTLSMLQLPLSGISRKRLQDALMLDEGQYELLRKRIRYDNNNNNNSNKEDSEDSSSEGENYGLFEGEFSHDDEEDKYDGLEEEEEGDDLENGFPLHTFTTTNYSSSSEGEIFTNKMEEGEGEDEEEWSGSQLLFHDIKEEEEESDSDGAWHLVGPSSISTSIPLISSPPTTTTTTSTTTTTTTTSSSSSPFSFLSSFTPSPPPSPPTTTNTTNTTNITNATNATTTRTTHTTKTPKRRDSPPPPSTRVIPRRTLS